MIEGSPAARIDEPRYYEGIDVGDGATFGSHEVTQAEIVEYAERYDPQPFHADPDHAGSDASHFETVIAPGWLTASISQRLLVGGYFPTIHNVAARGCDEVRWHRPVTPGDVLACRVEVVDRTARSDDRGQVDLRVELLDADGEGVFSMVALVVVERRPDR